MREQQVERRLAAILAADVAGYSRLMGADELGTLRALQAHRKQLIDPTIARHHGRIVKTTGDGMLVEFASVIDAVACAVAVQRSMAARNASVTAEKRIAFRVGINVGDIIVEGKDIHGDGVNVAARLETLAEPGGISVSRVVRDQVRDKLAFTFTDVGEQTVKNIARPIKVFGLAANDIAALGENPTAPRAVGSWGGAARWGALGSAVIVVLLAIGLSMLAASGGWWAREWSAGDGVTSSPGKPSMAVLAFDNLSGDPAQDYFSDGIAEEILTALASSPRLSVIARNSSFAYKGKSVGAIEIGKVLGVRYLLEGSVKRAGDRVRVTAQLVDARTGGHIWAEQYDRPLGDIFDVQDEVTAAIAARLGATIERAEADLTRRKAPADLGAYDYYLQGRIKRLTSDKTQQLEARELFRRAVALDPAFAPAYAELGHSYYTEVALRWDPARRQEALAEGFALTRKAIELDPTLPLAHLTMGNLHLRRHDYDEAAGWAERAMALGPSDPENYAGLANIYSFMGRAGDALALMRKAVELDPNYPPRYGMYLGRAYLFTRQPEAAMLYLRDAASRGPDYWPSKLFLAAAYGHLGQPDEAAAALSAVRRQIKLASLKDADPADDYRAGPEKDYFLEGLALAGLPPE